MNEMNPNPQNPNPYGAPQQQNPGQVPGQPMPQGQPPAGQPMYGQPMAPKPLVQTPFAKIALILIGVATAISIINMIVVYSAVSSGDLGSLGTATSFAFIAAILNFCLGVAALVLSIIAVVKDNPKTLGIIALVAVFVVPLILYFINMAIVGSVVDSALSGL